MEEGIDTTTHLVAGVVVETIGENTEAVTETVVITADVAAIVEEGVGTMVVMVIVETTTEVVTIAEAILPTSITDNPCKIRSIKAQILR